MTKSNYTLTIGQVLMKWLGDKGWDARNVAICDDKYCCEEDTSYGIFFEKNSGSGEVDFIQVVFCQSELDAQAESDKKIKNRSNGHIDRDTVQEYIRAELERQCDE